MASERQISGAVLRTHLAWLEKNAFNAAVRERVPADTRALVDKPPFAMSWIPAPHVDAILDALLAAGGEDSLVQMGEETTRSSLGALVRPLLQTLMSLFGGSPAVLFSRLDASIALFVKGASFTYEPGGECEGIVRLNTVDRASRGFFLLWKGVLRFGFEVASTEGWIQSCEIDPDGKGAVFQVAWSDRATA